MVEFTIGSVGTLPGMISDAHLAVVRWVPQMPTQLPVCRQPVSWCLRLAALTFSFSSLEIAATFTRSIVRCLIAESRPRTTVILSCTEAFSGRCPFDAGLQDSGRKITNCGNFMSGIVQAHLVVVDQVVDFLFDGLVGCELF